MTPGANAVLLREFDEAIDRLEGALRRCPPSLWEASLWRVERAAPGVWPTNGRPEPGRTDETIQVFAAVWKIAYHVLFYLDWYVTTELLKTPLTPDGSFAPPPFMRGGVEERPFTDDWTLRLPDEVYPREQLLRYLDHGRLRARRVISGLSDEALAAICPTHHPHEGKTLADLLRINLAHLREHGGQIDQFLATRSSD